MLPRTLSSRLSHPLVAACLLALFAADGAAQPQQLPPVPVPPGNQITEAKRVLGKILFWDEQLSSDNTMACGTCHLPASGGADPRFGTHPGADGVFGTDDDVVASPGMVRSDDSNVYLPDENFGLDVQVTGRAAPTYFSMTQYSPSLFWDGRATANFVDPQTGVTVLQAGAALESQAVGPILSPAEMGHDGRTWDQVIAKLESVTPLRLASNIPPDMAAAVSQSPSYQALFGAAFADGLVSARNIGLAIATYERTLVPDQTPFDAFAAGNPQALTPAQNQGFQFLQQTAACLVCHRPPFFSNFGFHNLGLRPSAEDLGREAITGNPNHRGEFRTPSLRNVGLRDQLMHVGWITNVADAIAFYNAPPFPQVGPTGHSQFTQDQSLIPSPPGAPPGPPLGTINIPPFQIGPIVDFLSNALTDPRAAAETFPFDRPTLHSEVAPANPALISPGSMGTGGIVPRMLAVTPLTVANPDFKFGLDDGLGGAPAWLLLGLAPTAPGTTVHGGVPLGVAPPFLFTGVVPTAGVGAGAGHTTVLSAVDNDPALVGLQLFGQWFVIDRAAQGGLASSPAVRWTGI